MIPKSRLEEALRRVMRVPGKGDERAHAAYEEAQEIARETGAEVGAALWALATLPDPTARKRRLEPKPEPSPRGRSKDRVWSPPAGQGDLFGGGL